MSGCVTCPTSAPRAGEATAARRVPASALAQFVGTYRAEGGDVCRVIRLRDGTLGVQLFERPDTMPIVAARDSDFTFRDTGGRVHFTPGAGSAPTRVDVSIAEVERSYAKVP